MRNKIIHGKCSHFYCGNCVKTESKVDALGEGCKFYMSFNKYEFLGNKKEMI